MKYAVLFLFFAGCGEIPSEKQVQIIGTVKEFNQTIEFGYSFIDIVFEEENTTISLRSENPISGEWIGKKEIGRASCRERV